MHFPLRLQSHQMHLQQLYHRFVTTTSSSFNRMHRKVDERQSDLISWQKQILETEKKAVSDEKQNLLANMQLLLKQMNDKMKMQSALLDAYSPLKILARGYSVVTKDKQPVKDAAMLQEKDRVTIRLYNGSVEAEIMEVTHGRED